MISKSIPEVVSNGSVNVTSIPVSGSTGFNYIFIENCGAPGQYFDSSYSDTYLSNFGVSIVKKDISRISIVGNGVIRNYEQLMNKKIGVKNKLKGV